MQAPARQCRRGRLRVGTQRGALSGRGVVGGGRRAVGSGLAAGTTAGREHPRLREPGGAGRAAAGPRGLEHGQRTVDVHHVHDPRSGSRAPRDRPGAVAPAAGSISSSTGGPTIRAFRAGRTGSSRSTGASRAVAISTAPSAGISKPAACASSISTPSTAASPNPSGTSTSARLRCRRSRLPADGQ